MAACSHSCLHSVIHTCADVVCRKPEEPELTPEERDARTVVCMQLASRIRSEDLQEFFSSVGKVMSLVPASCLASGAVVN